MCRLIILLEKIHIMHTNMSRGANFMIIESIQSLKYTHDHNFKIFPGID